MSEALQKILRKGRDVPAKFCKVFWPGGEPWQHAVFEAVHKYRRTSVVSCNGAGKTWVGARVIVTFLLAHPGSVVITTAGTWQQVRRQLWKEIITARNRLPKILHLGKINTTDWNMTTEWHAIGVSTHEANHFEGFHARYILVVVDEAKSVKQGIFDAINRIFAGNSEKVRLLMISSPGRASGAHYDSHHSKAEMYCRIKVSPFECYMETPDGKHIDLPPTRHLSKEYIEEMMMEYGPNSPLFISMVKAGWCANDEWALFHADGLDDAKLDLLPPEGVPYTVRIGADVARNEGDGDECSFYAVWVWDEQKARKLDPERKVKAGRHYRIVDHEEFFTKDSTIFGNKLKLFAARNKCLPENINVDGTGLGGPCCDYLRDEGFMVNCVPFGAAPTVEQPLLGRMRDQLWYVGSEICRLGLLHNLTDDRTRAQLGVVRYGFQIGTGKIQVEPKELLAIRMRKENPRCPWKSSDRADGVLLAINEGDIGEAASFDILEDQLKDNGRLPEGNDTTSWEQMSKMLTG